MLESEKKIQTTDNNSLFHPTSSGRARGEQFPLQQCPAPV